MSHLNTFIAPSPPSDVTAIRMANEREMHAVVATPGLVDKLVAMSPVEVTPFVPRSRKIGLYNPSLEVS